MQNLGILHDFKEMLLGNGAYYLSFRTHRQSRYYAHGKFLLKQML